MLQNFIICVNAVIPSAIYLIIGITLKVTGVIKDEEVKKFTHVVFVTLYPFIMFDNLYGKNIADNMDVKLGLYAVGFTVLQFAASWIFVCAIEKSNYERGAMIQALYRSNYVLMGFPIAVNLFGKGNITAVAIIMMLVVPFYNITAVIVFETFRGGKVNFGQMLKRILTNPIIDGGIAAFIVMMLGIKLPPAVEMTVGTLSDATSPVAMILLGAALNLKGFRSDRVRILICTLGKLVVFPALGITGAVLLGITGVQLIAVTLMVAAPVALASYAMASSMGGNGELAGELVVITTVCSCFTIPVFLFILKTNGLF
jgi:predicted permease